MAMVLNAGVIGCGSRAGLYGEAAAQVPALKLRAYCDVRRENADRFLAAYGGDYATTDAQQVLDDPTLDAVLICTWHDTHTKLAVEAARRGKHILIEKPLALTIDECWQIEEAVTRAGVTMTVGLKMRYMPIVRRVRDLVQRPIMLVGQMLNDTVPDDSWSLQGGVGGGSVLGAGCHTADLLCYLAGSDPVEVYAGGGDAIHRKPGMVDHVIAVIKFANGAVASLIHGDPGRNPYVSTFFCEVMAVGKGACLHDRFRRATLWGCEQTQLGINDLNEDERVDVEGDAALLRDFTHSALEGRPSHATVRSGRIASTIMCKILDSVRTGLPQQIEADWRSRYG